MPPGTEVESKQIVPASADESCPLWQGRSPVHDVEGQASQGDDRIFAFLVINRISSLAKGNVKGDRVRKLHAMVVLFVELRFTYSHLSFASLFGLDRSWGVCS